MKVIILAAGMGSRLGDSTLPKPLTLLENGQSILELQLTNIAAFIPLSQVIVIVGFHKEMIMERFPDLLYVYNPHYAQENTSKSLLRALNKLDEDVLWMNGDVVFHYTVLEKLLLFDRTSMVVNKSDVDAEGVKYRTNEQGRILEVSKEVKEPEGEALGINLFKEADLSSLKKNLSECSDHDYFEKGIEGCIKEGIDVWSVSIEATQCTEVDFPEDLQRANAYLKNWSE